MHWNQIEYAKGEEVEVFSFNVVWRGFIVGVHVKPVSLMLKTPVWYYVRTSEGVNEYPSTQVRRVQG